MHGNNLKIKKGDHSRPFFVIRLIDNTKINLESRFFCDECLHRRDIG